MSEHIQNNDGFLRKVIVPFLIYVALFIGTGFISGAVVHYPVAPTRNFIIGIIGATLFTIATTINEALFNKKNLREEGVIKFILYSLLLSLGIGMVSGGTQHFFDTPVYASYLIPAGLLIGLVAFILQRNIQFTIKVLLSVLGCALLVALPLWLFLYTSAKQIPATVQDDHHSETVMDTQRTGSGNQDDRNTMNMMEMMEQGMDHGTMVNSEADFIMEMIPHHQEAIDTSNYMLSRTEDEEFKDFLQAIVDAQTGEVAMMKEWHQDWFGSAYEDDGRYEPMMPDLETINDYEDARRQYLMGMVMHHMGAIQMAAKIKTISQRPELMQLADNIIRSQNEEIEQMRSWLMQTGGSGMMNNDNGSMMMDHMGH